MPVPTRIVGWLLLASQTVAMKTGTATSMAALTTGTQRGAPRKRA